MLIGEKQSNRPACIIFYDDPISRVSNIYLTPVFVGKTPVYSGQISKHQLLALREPLNRLSNNLKMYYLVGSPIQKSPSPNFHNQAFFKESMHNKYYELYETISVERVEKLLNTSNTYGLSITTPLKSKVQYLCHKIESPIPHIINTIIRKDNRFVGYNTDSLALQNVLNGIPCQDRSDILVIGSGSTAEIAICTCKEMGFTVYLSARNIERSNFLLKTYNIQSIHSKSHNKEFQYGVACVPLCANLECKVKQIIDFAYGGYRRVNTWVDGHDLFIKQAKIQSELFCSG